MMDGTPGLNNAGMVFVRAVVSRLGMLVTSLGFFLVGNLPKTHPAQLTKIYLLSQHSMVLNHTANRSTNAGNVHAVSIHTDQRSIVCEAGMSWKIIRLQAQASDSLQ